MVDCGTLGLLSIPSPPAPCGFRSSSCRLLLVPCLSPPPVDRQTRYDAYNHIPARFSRYLGKPPISFEELPRGGSTSATSAGEGQGGNYLSTSSDHLCISWPRWNTCPYMHLQYVGPGHVGTRVPTRKRTSNTAWSIYVALVSFKPFNEKPPSPSPSPLYHLI